MTELNKIRNFSIVAHIDHGKSTLADRLIQETGTVKDRDMKEQLLDAMDIERERGITIKAQTVRLDYKARDGQTYVLNLMDTPGHVDFTYEVSRSLAACEGALLMVDATQGIEAQTMANFYLALEHDLEIIPVINKVDLPSAEPDAVAVEIEMVLCIKNEDCLRCSAKTGVGVHDILEAVVEHVPAPTPLEPEEPKALIFDAHFDPYRGVICYVRIYGGDLKRGQKIRMMSTDLDFEVLEVGYFRPKMTKTDQNRSKKCLQKRSRLRTVLRPSWGDLGAILASSWEAFGSQSGVSPRRNYTLRKVTFFTR